MVKLAELDFSEIHEMTDCNDHTNARIRLCQMFNLPVLAASFQTIEDKRIEANGLTLEQCTEREALSKELLAHVRIHYGAICANSVTASL